MSPRLRARLYDLKFSRTLREAAGWAHLGRALLKRAPAGRAAHCGSARGFLDSRLGARLLQRLVDTDPSLQDAASWRQAVAGHPGLKRAREALPTLSRTIILKPPLPGGEKGVLLSTFEYNWSKLLLSLPPGGFEWLDRHYDLILSSSSSPTHYGCLALAARLASDTVFVQACNHRDRPVIEAWHPRLRCLPTMPCDWLNPSLFHPKPLAERTRDITMVSFWGEVKRHWEFLEALARLPANLKITLIGQRDGQRTRETMLELARAAGVPQQLEILESIPVQQVYDVLCDSKVSVIMSLREGCCVAAVESLFAGCALAMRADAHVGPLDYIDDHTGARLRPGHTAEDLLTLLQRAGEMQPATWANAHISGRQSHAQVNAQLQAHARERGRPWTRDLALPQWRPHPTFVHTEEQEALRPAYAELHQRFPTVFPDNLWSESWR